jgi:hypothetical protein
VVVASVLGLWLWAPLEARGGQLIWEKAADVHQFFENHPELAGLPEARRVKEEVARLAHNRLIPKWGGVHLCEGAWDDTGDPYWGGLQMDREFQAGYGSEFLRWWGLAHAWPPWAQMTAAERAYRSGRGLAPWPTCGQYAWS